MVFDIAHVTFGEVQLSCKHQTESGFLLAAGAEAKYAAHAGILDSARAIVNDLRKTGVLRKLFQFDPGANGGPQPPPIFPSSRASECLLKTPSTALRTQCRAVFLDVILSKSPIAAMRAMCCVNHCM